MNSSIIDKNTFEVYEHSEDYKEAFICDRPLAKVLALLNKKGYKTFASCSGHYEIKFYEYFDEDISKLDEVLKNDRIIVKKVKDKTFDYWAEADNCYVYILFAEEYNFSIKPDGFTVSKLTDKDPRTHIYSSIEFYDEHSNHKSKQEVEKEINDKCNELLKWATKL